MPIEFGSPQANEVISADREMAIEEEERKTLKWVKCRKCKGTGRDIKRIGNNIADRFCSRCDGEGSLLKERIDGVWMYVIE